MKTSRKRSPPQMGALLPRVNFLYFDFGNNRLSCWIQGENWFENKKTRFRLKRNGVYDRSIAVYKTSAITAAGTCSEHCQSSKEKSKSHCGAATPQ